MDEKAPAYTEIPVQENKNLLSETPVVTEVKSYQYISGGSTPTNTANLFCGLCGVCACIAISICCFFFIVAIIMAGVFGSWAVNCSKDTYFASMAYQDPSISFAKTINIETTGDILFNEVQFGSPSLEIKANLTSGYQEAINEDSIEVELASSSSEKFSFESDFSWWYCTIVDVEATYDSSTISGTIEIRLTTVYGDIVYTSSNNSKNHNIELEAVSGSIRGKVLGKSLVGESVSGNILLDSIEAQDVTLGSVSGNIEVPHILSQFVEIDSVSGKVDSAISLISQNSGKECKTELDSVSGDIYIDYIDFPSNTICNVNIDSTSGRVTLNLRNFSGTINLSSSSGSITYNGDKFGNEVNRSVDGPTAHSVIIETTSGDIVLNIV